MPGLTDVKRRQFTKGRHGGAPSINDRNDSTRRVPTNNHFVLKSSKLSLRVRDQNSSRPMGKLPVTLPVLPFLYHDWQLGSSHAVHFSSFVIISLYLSCTSGFTENSVKP